MIADTVETSIESGTGKDLGEEALSGYTELKAVHVNLTAPPPF